MHKRTEAILGFGVNPEITWTNEKTPMGERIPADADFHISGTSYDVALALKKCGLNPLLVGAVGKGKVINKAIEEDLRSRNIDNLLLEIREETPWACIEPESKRRLSFNRPIIKQESETLSRLAAHHQPQFKVITGLRPLKEELEMAKALFSNTGIRILTPGFQFSEKQYRGAFFELAGMTDWLVMNKHEAAAHLGCQPDEITLDSLQMLLDLGPDMAIVTRDKDGVLMLDKEGRRKNLKALRIKAKDETGAGDCFLGFFIASIHKGYSRDEALKIATVAGGIKASRLGTTNIPTWPEVMEKI